MSHLLARSTATPGVGSAPSAVDSTQPNSLRILVAEQEVVFSTTAAISIPPVTTRRRLGARLIAAIGQILTLPEPRPHNPRRDPNYFEAARMSREMDHL
jgi:hypothetical protein